jgi:hypothetical protein
MFRKHPMSFEDEHRLCTIVRYQTSLKVEFYVDGNALLAMIGHPSRGILFPWHFAEKALDVLFGYAEVAGYFLERLLGVFANVADNEFVQPC